MCKFIREKIISSKSKDSSRFDISNNQNFLLEVIIDSKKNNIIDEIKKYKEPEEKIVVICQSKKDKLFGAFFNSPWEPCNSQNKLFSLTDQIIFPYNESDNDYLEDNILKEFDLKPFSKPNDKSYLQILRIGQEDLIIYQDSNGNLFCKSRLGDNFKRNDKDNQYIFGSKFSFPLKRVIVFIVISNSSVSYTHLTLPTTPYV